MNEIRRALCLLVAIVLVAFALPSAAAPQYTKQYSLTLTSDPSIPLTVVADLSNSALGPGNSNIGSFRLTFTGATIASVTTNPAIPPGNVIINGSSVTVLLPTALQGGQHFILTIVLNDCGDAISLLQNGVQVWTGNLGGQTFSPSAGTVFPLTASVVCDILGCGDSDVVPSSFAPGSVTVMRGDRDKNGDDSVAACAGIPYTYTSFTNNTVHFAWPPTYPAAAWEFTVYSPGPLPAPGTTGVAYLNTDGSPVTNDPFFIRGNDFVPPIPTALDCIAPKDLPAPYATLLTTITATSLSIRVDIAAPAGETIAHASSFDTVIGTERIRISSTHPSGPGGQETWTVAVGGRGVGGTTAAAHTAGPTALFMSTPLPILPNNFVFGAHGPYMPNTQALACIVEQGLFPNPLTGPNHFTTFSAVLDPWGSQP